MHLTQYDLLYIKLILYYTLPSIDKNDKIELEKLLISTLNEEKGAELMTSLAQAWKEEGIEIGILDGIKIGKAEGKAEGEHKKAVAVAINLLKAGLMIDLIAESTGLSAEEIVKLKV